MMVILSSMMEIEKTGPSGVPGQMGDGEHPSITTEEGTS